MPSTATIKCPACGKVNRELHRGQATPCTRCGVDLQALVRIQLASAQLQTKLCQQLAAQQPEQAQATLAQMQALSPTAATHSVQQLLSARQRYKTTPTRSCSAASS